MASILIIIQQQDEEYDRLHALYHEAKQRIEDATTPEELEAATIAFHPIQQAFLRNREQAIPTECYQIIASYLDRLSRARLAECNKHLHYQVIYGKYSGRFVWSVGGLLEQVYRRDDNSWDELTMTPLQVASREGTARVVRVLIDAKADLEDVGDCDRTPLHWACERGHEEVVGVLIDAGANVNALCDDDESALYFAAEANSLPVVHRLLTAGANPNPNEHSPLHEATRNNNCEIVDAILNAKADANHFDRGATALHCAISCNALDVIPNLVAGGANVNHKDHIGRTPLVLASRFSQLAAVAALLAVDANPNILDTDGWSPLMHASSKQANVSIVRALLAANANVHLVSCRGRTALNLAKQLEHNDEVVRLLDE